MMVYDQYNIRESLTTFSKEKKSHGRREPDKLVPTKKEQSFF